MYSQLVRDHVVKMMMLHSFDAVSLTVDTFCNQCQVSCSLPGTSWAAIITPPSLGDSGMAQGAVTHTKKGLPLDRSSTTVWSVQQGIQSG